MALVDTVKMGFMTLNLEDNCPIMQLTGLSSLDLCPVEPVMMSTLLSIDMLKLDVLELSLEVVIDKWNDQVEVALCNFVGDINLLEGIMRVGVLLLVMMVLVVMLVAHLIFNYSPFSKICVLISYQQF